MIDLFTRFFTHAEPVLAQAGPRDAGAFATLHAASFQRGWSDGEFETLLRDRNISAHRATSGGSLAGFIISRLVEGEAEILSVAVAKSRQGRGLARRLLSLHLSTLAGRGAVAVFLEVDEANIPALRLYQRAGFEEVGRRAGYYRDNAGRPSTALVLRRDLA